MRITNNCYPEIRANDSFRNFTKKSYPYVPSI